MNRKTLFALLLLTLGSFVAASPSLSLTTSATDPMPVTPGDTVTVYVSLQNTGSTPGEDITVQYNGHNFLNLVHPSDEQRTVNVLGSQEDTTLAYDFEVPSDVPPGSFSVPFTVSAANSRTTLNTEIEVDVQPQKPILHVSSVTTTPDPLRPGQQGSISLRLLNQGERALEDIDVSMDVDNTPFLPVGQSNTERVNQLLAGEETDMTFQITTQPDTESSIYEAPFTVTYDDTTGETNEKTVSTGINVGSDPELIATVREAELTTTQRQGEISLSIVNKGLSKVKLVQAELLDHDTYSAEDATSYYLGDVESDDFDVVTFTAEAQNDTVNIPVRLTYRTAFNDEQTVRRTATYSLPEGETSSGTTWYVVSALVVIAGLWWYRRRR